MNNSKLSKEDKKQAALENHEENERIHALVVKIISWRSGILDGAIIQKNNKVTPKEWEEYKKHLLRISKVESPERVKEKLNDTYESIKKRGGFEKP